MFRKNYESPLTVYQRVEVESAFCGASSVVKNPENCGIKEHEINGAFDGDFSNDGWDQGTPASL